MVDPVTSTRLGYQAAFVGLAALVLFVRALPLSAVPAVIPAPDLLLCLAIAWGLRRPDFIPVVVIVAVFLMEDILSMRPPGLWTLIVLFGTEFLRSRATLTRDLPFLLEWAMVGVVIATMTIVNRIALGIFFVPQTGLGPVLLQVVVTLIAYPLVVAVLHSLLGLRKAAPGQVDALGHRL